MYKNLIVKLKLFKVLSFSWRIFFLVIILLSLGLGVGISIKIASLLIAEAFHIQMGIMIILGSIFISVAGTLLAVYYLVYD